MQVFYHAYLFDFRYFRPSEFNSHNTSVHNKLECRSENKSFVANAAGATSGEYCILDAASSTHSSSNCSDAIEKSTEEQIIEDENKNSNRTFEDIEAMDRQQLIIPNDDKENTTQRLSFSNTMETCHSSTQLHISEDQRGQAEAPCVDSTNDDNKEENTHSGDKDNFTNRIHDSESRNFQHFQGSLLSSQSSNLNCSYDRESFELTPVNSQDFSNNGEGATTCDLLSTDHQPLQSVKNFFLSSTKSSTEKLPLFKKSIEKKTPVRILLVYFSCVRL